MNSWCCLRARRIPGRYPTGAGDQGRKSKHQDLFLSGPHVTVLPGEGADRLSGNRLLGSQGIRPHRRGVRKASRWKKFWACRTARTAGSSTIPTVREIQDLDSLPHVTDVYKRDLDVTRYNVPFLLHPYVALYSTRGCPAQCTFCLWPQTLSGHPWRKRSSDDIAREMAKAKEHWPNVKEFFFDDDTFNIQKARTIELCAKLKPLGLTWSCTSRVTTDFETLKAMKEAGCRLLIVGYESGDAQILKNVKKGATVERAREFTRDCHKLDLVVHGDFILGLPGETRETIRNTINFAKELDVETIQVSVAHAYPGTSWNCTNTR